MRENGFSLIEVVVAHAVLALVVQGLAATTANHAQAADQSGDPLAAVESRYEGVEETIPGVPGYRRTTSITRVNQAAGNGRWLDYQRVLVTVEGPGLKAPIRRTITIAAP